MNLRVLIFGVLIVCVIPSVPLRAAEAGVELLGVRKIWDAAPHCAFTDLLKFKDAYYCVFRESSAHIPGLDGKIRVLRSVDGEKWESVALVAEKGIDLRDPKISEAPDGRLMLLMGGSVYDGAEPTPKRKRVSAHSRVSFSGNATEWSTPLPVTGIGDDQWLWQMAWHKGVGYAAVYSTTKVDGKRIFTVWKTSDAVKYEKLADLKPGIDLSEAAIRFAADDTMIVLLRGEEKDRHAWIGASAAPYEKWDWKDGGHAAQGPNFIVLGDGRMFYAGRDFQEKGAAKTVFGRMTREGLEPLITFPSGGDTSYSGIADAGNGELWVSYYSSHEEGQTSIYLAKVRVGR
ncbi:MAG: hypothetical protein JWN40_564 [Phycisphaerales bacterium]|nr:hypothetical protein [Phycisphaerales bacterium]